MTDVPHVPSLTIEHFRGIHTLQLPSLGRVTLLAGSNGVGKTTVLDAIRCYASRGDARVLVNLLETREEFVPGTDEDGDTLIFPDFASLFNAGHYNDEMSPIRIRSESTDHDLVIELLEHAPADAPLHVDEDERSDIKIFLGQRSKIVAAASFAYYSAPTGGSFRLRRTTRVSRSPDDWPPPIRSESLGPAIPDKFNIARLWDALALTEGEELAIRALRLVVGKDLERMTLVGTSPRYDRALGRRAVVKLKSSAVPVPLKRLGDGANRLFALALALANSRKGVLTIDEVENGVHYSVHAELWRMIFQAAVAADIQVLAATHSWDCITGFAQAAVESPAEGTLYRLERFDNVLQAISYSEDDLETAAAQRIEVR